jgi:hypothetical protein
MPLPTLQTTNQGFPAQFSSKVENVRSSNQGDNVYVTAASGDCLIAVAFGLRSYDPFDLLHGASPAFGFLQGQNDFNANPVISDHVSITPVSPVSLELGVASQFALLGASTITNTGATVVTGGDLGLTPGSSVTGFPPGVIAPPSSEQIDTPLAVQAQAAASAAFTFYQGMATTQSVTTADLGTQNGGGGVGVYRPGKYTSPSSIALTTSITLDAQGNPNAVFVFYATASTITQAAAAGIFLINGAQAANVVWLAGSSFTSVGAAVSVGTILAEASVTLGGGSLTGRAIALTAAITISAACAITNTASTGGAGNQWVLATNLNLVDSDYTVATTPPTAPNPYPSSKWSLDGYYPSVYIWVAQNALAGTYAVNLNSVYQDGIIAPGDLAAGKPIFDGGVNFQVFKFSGILTSGASDGAAIGTSVAAAAAAPAFTTTQGSELLLSVGLMKSGNAFSLGSVIQAGTPTADVVSRISNGKLVGSEAHYTIEYAVPAAASATTQLSFSNPLGYEMVVGTIALKHS